MVDVIIRKITASFVLVAFLLTSGIAPVRYAYGQGEFVSTLPEPGAMVALSVAFVPVLIKGMTIYPDNPLRFDFIVDSGNTKFTPDQIKQESNRLVKYFLAAMTIPQDDLWVNLSPYEAGQIIPDALGKTGLGRDMLAQDYILKQLSASLLDPEKNLGKDFWAKVYKQAQEKFGVSGIPVDTFNKVWIMPEEATVYERGNAVYVIKSRLKVMLDKDYKATQVNQKSAHSALNQASDSAVDDMASISSQITREIILPEITREVNEGKNFAVIRQIYQALILAKWYKETAKEGLFSKVYINQRKIKGVDLSDSTLKDQIYDRYVEAFKKGVVNFIREEQDPVRQEVVPRKYFSGGEIFGVISLNRIPDGATVNASSVGDEYKLEIRVDPLGKAVDKVMGSNGFEEVRSAVNMFEFDKEGLDVALDFFHSPTSVSTLQEKLSKVRGVERVDWKDGVVTIIGKTEVVKVHLKGQEINERLGLIDRFYIKHCKTCAEAAVKIYHRDARDDVRRQNKPVYVLGVVRAGHDSVASLIKDGVLVGALEEERLNFDKHTVAYFPKEATRYLLKSYGITWQDIDHIAVSFDYNFYRETSGSKDPHYDYRQKHGLPFKEAYQRYNTERYEAYLEELAAGYGTGYVPPVTFVKHHKAHAAAAYYASGFTEPTLVVSIDGQGEDESTSIWLGKEGKLTKIASTTPFTHSLGHFYHIVTVYLGYKRNDEGQVMGYAPYGAPKNAVEKKTVSQLREMMQELIRFNPQTEQIELDMKDYELTKITALPGIKFSENFLERLGKIVPPMPEGKTGRDLRPEDRVRAHLAFVMQERVEQVINDMVSYFLHENRETRGVKHVVMGGGLALNIASNGKLIKNGIVEADKFFVPAYPADDGTAIGAALSVADEEYGSHVQNEVKKISFGKTYSDEEIQNALDRFGLVKGVDYQRIENDEQLLKEVADAIVNDKTVAWFQGGAELGSRALGNRSILNRLNDPEGNLKVNRIKNREPWRPSALSIQEEHAAEFLDGVSTSPFMSIAFPVTETKKDVIRAGAHPEDGTTRPQTVSREANPLYWSLLGEMGRRTSVPGLLNTSFNKRGPIVETPEDALNTYYYGQGLDLLAMGHFIILRKDGITPSVLNGGDEAGLKDFFMAGRDKSAPLTEAWNKFWTDADSLLVSRSSGHQHYLAVYVADPGNEREVLRIPLVKEMFQDGSRKFFIADIAARIQRGIGRDVPVTVSIETTAPQFQEVVVDLFKRFVPDDIQKNWNIVKCGFANPVVVKKSSEQVLATSIEAAGSLNEKISGWRIERRGNPVLVAVTGTNVRGRDSLVGQLQGPHCVIDARRWELEGSQRNNVQGYPFSSMRFNDYVHALERLRQGQTALIPLRQTLSTGTSERGAVLLSDETKEKYRSFLVKKNSKVWVRHDGRLFEEVKPEVSDVFVVNTSVVLNYPVLRNLFQETYFVATINELEQVSKAGDNALALLSLRGMEFAGTVVQADAAQGSGQVEMSWSPLHIPWSIKTINTVCVALTNYCPVGCLFCFMRSVRNKIKKASLDEKAVTRILSYVKGKNVSRLVLSGGETLTEMPTVLRIIREADVSSITIFTSGFFATNMALTQGVLNQLSGALEERKRAGKDPLSILFEVSVDEFHLRTVPKENIMHIIKVFEEFYNDKYAGVSLMLKGIFMPSDPVPGIIESLGGNILEGTERGNYPSNTAVFQSGYQFPIRYSEVKLMEDMLDTKLAKKEFHKDFEKRLNDGVRLVEADGVIFSVNYDGVASIHDYLAKDFQLANANNDDFSKNIEARLTTDPLVVAFRQFGMKTIFDIAVRLRPHILDRSIAANNHFLAVSDILKDDELRHYVYQELTRLIEPEFGRGSGISNEKGGIDLNGIEVERTGSGRDIKFDPAMRQDILDQGVDGFVPVIIDLTPIHGILPVAGLKEPMDRETDSRVKTAAGPRG